jgi:type VI secretion system secreted protein Hcp
MNKVGLLASSFLIAAAVAASTSASAAYSFLVTATGQRTGKFNGPVGGKIPAIAFSYSVRSPRDPASGLATGKRQHSPIAFTKPWDATSPLFFNSIVSNENLPSVLFEFTQPDAKGLSQVYQTVKLTNASVSGITRRASASSGPTDLEDITLTFQKIEITHVTGGITASDDWEAQVN